MVGAIVTGSIVTGGIVTEANVISVPSELCIECRAS